MDVENGDFSIHSVGISREHAKRSSRTDPFRNSHPGFGPAARVTRKAWVDLDRENLREILISLIGYRFGDRPEEHVDEIREERARYARKFIRMARISSSDRVLELGSGCGFGTAAIADRAAEVIACDISPAYLDIARHECKNLENIRFIEIDSRDLSPVEDASVDAVLSMAVFIHLNLYDIHLYFHEHRRVLRPGGRVVIDFADADDLFSRFRGRAADEQFLSHADHYHNNPDALPALMQWNSERGIRGVARSANLRFVRRSGHKLLFKKRS